MQGTPAGLSWRDKGYPGGMHALLVGSFGVRERLGSPAHSSLSQSSGVLSAALPTPRMVPSCLAWPQRDFLLGTWGRHGHNHRSPELSPSCGGQPGWLTRWSQCARTTLVDQAGRPKNSLKYPKGMFLFCIVFKKDKYSKTLMSGKKKCSITFTKLAMLQVKKN